MINVENYMDDGANWQAQSVLAYIRSLGYCPNIFYNKETRNYDVDILVGRCENCREQGYIFALRERKSFKVLMNYWVYEHRNSDDLCVVKFEGSFLNTPTINEIPMKHKNDITQSFGYGQIVECGQYIIDDMKYIYEKEKENTQLTNE